MPAAIDTMAYTGATPWHGLGTEVPAGITGDVDAMRIAAGLTWEPALLTLKYRYQQQWRDAPRSAMVRDDTGALLDIVGPDYTPIRNAEVVDFFREYCAAGDMTIETLGSLAGGSYVWCLAKMHTSFGLPGDDTVDGYVLLANPHVYGKSATAKMTAIRVVCKNTLAMALKGGGTRIFHINEFDADRRAGVQAELGIARERFDAFETNATTLAATTLDDETARTLIVRIVAADSAFAKDRTTGKRTAEFLDPDVWASAPRTVRRVYELYDGAAMGAALPSATETAWGLLNAITQYVDWERGKTHDRRVAEAWFGSGDVLKRRALDELTTAAHRAA